MKIRIDRIIINLALLNVILFISIFQIFPKSTCCFTQGITSSSVALKSVK
ncbi:MAG: hypothetical protein LBP83_08615 [Dysgonamonadaceae bacterium]|nr:hypothetical protein [Dysgonamonadaceae bacterium]